MQDYSSALLDSISYDLPDGVSMLPCSDLDLRPDSEIVSYLLQHHPVTTEKNVWAFWDKGFINMPPWLQRNVIGWVRRLGSEWTVRVLDHVPGSPVHVEKFIDSSWFPEAYKENTMTGPYVAHYQSDFARLGLLYVYGGVWLDVGTLLFRHLDDIFWNAINDVNTPYEVGAFAIVVDNKVGSILNGFIGAKAGNEFLRRWHKICLELWKGKTNTVGMHNHPLLRHLGFAAATEGPEAIYWTDYLAHMQACKRLCLLDDPSDGFNGAKYFEEKFFIVDFSKELCYLQIETEWKGHEQLKLLATRLDETGPTGQATEDYSKAKKIVEHMVARSSALKVSHGINGAKQGMLAHLWDLPENNGADAQPGTFAAYLRYATIHFRQTRALLPLKFPAAEKIYRRRLTEAVE